MILADDDAGLAILVTTWPMLSVDAQRSDLDSAPLQGSSGLLGGSGVREFGDKRLEQLDGSSSIAICGELFGFGKQRVGLDVHLFW